MDTQKGSEAPAKMPSEVSETRIKEIHAVAHDALVSKDGAFKARDHLRELRPMGRSRNSIVYTEAFIMLLVILRLWPSRTTRQLDKLRKKRERRKEMDQFEAFYQKLRDNLAPLQLTNHGYNSGVFEALDHEVIWDTVRKHMSVLEGMGYEVFLNSGTLLGVVRDKKLLDHDDDVDFGLLLKANTEKEAGIEWLALRDALKKEGLFDPKSYRGTEVFKLKPVAGVEIDLFPAWIEKDRVYVYPHTYGELHRDEVFPLKPCPVTGQAIPAEPEKMLAVNYGPSWDVPNPVFKFEWGRASKKFAKFLKQVK